MLPFILFFLEIVSKYTRENFFPQIKETNIPNLSMQVKYKMCRVDTDKYRYVLCHNIDTTKNIWKDCTLMQCKQGEIVSDFF